MAFEQRAFTDAERMELRSHVELAGEAIAPYWPMRTFIHHNPLHGLEDLPFDQAVKRGEPAQLAADFRMVVPAGEPIRMQIGAADVIHSFAVPSLWFKLDGVPGRLNEKVLFINEPGVYYGQCSELCGARHGYMPITVEALPRDKFNAWVLTQSGGKIDGQPEPAAAAPAAAAPVAAGASAPAAPATPAPAA